jgi:hypothetical protein
MGNGDKIEIVEIAENRSALCREILTALPSWFGIPESLEAYVRDSATLPMLGAMTEGGAIGFISLKDQTVRHRSLRARRETGMAAQGRRATIVRVRRRWAAASGRSLLYRQDRGSPRRRSRLWRDAGLLRGVGFKAIEVFPTLWHERNPCLFMLKPLG